MPLYECRTLSCFHTYNEHAQGVLVGSLVCKGRKCTYLRSFKYDLCLKFNIGKQWPSWQFRKCYVNYTSLRSSLLNKAGETLYRLHSCVVLFGVVSANKRGMNVGRIIPNKLKGIKVFKKKFSMHLILFIAWA